MWRLKTFSGSVDAYWVSAGSLARSSNKASKLGFLKELLLARSSLKCIPLDLRSRKRLNFAVTVGFASEVGSGGKEATGCEG